jgi:hypothetical protein
VFFRVFASQLTALRADFAAMLPRCLRRLSSAQRKALLVTLISMLGWSLWNGLRTYEHPWGDLSKGKFTDHFSHMNAARIFPHMGIDIWRVPIASKYRALTWAEMAETPKDIQAGASLTGGVYYVPGWPKDKPLAIGWSQKTRMYPPGDMLLVAPIAIAYHYTSLTLTGACRLLLGWFIVLAHVALYFFFLNLFESKGSGLDWLVTFFVYSPVMYWTIEGFYDAVAIVPLVLCARYIHRRRGLAAGVAYCVGALLHFRVFFQAPWALWALGLMLRDRFWRRLRVRHVLGILVALVCACVSLLVFWLDWKSLRGVQIFNPFFHAFSAHDKAMLWNFKVLLVLCGAVFLTSRAWLDLISLAWLGLAAIGLREFYYWHLVISTAWIAAPAKRPVVRAARLVFIMTTVAILFGDPSAPSWLWMLHQGK